MEQANQHAKVRLPAGKLAVATAGGALTMGLLAAGIASLGEVEAGLWALAAMACVVIPAGFMATLLFAIGPVGVPSAGIILIYGSFGRTVASLGFGAAIFLLAEPPAMAFWAGFLLSGVAALVGETLVSIRAMKTLEVQADRPLDRERALSQEQA